MKIIILGAGASGSTTAFELRRLDKKTDITVVDKEIKSCSPCAFPYVIGGEIKEKDIFVIKEEDYKQNNIKRLYSDIKKIDTKKKKVILEAAIELDYDKLVIATGSKAFIPPIKGIDTANYFTLKNLKDEQKIKKAAKTARKAVFIGGGWIGIELARALASKGIKVTILEAKDRIVSGMIDKEITDEIKKILEKQKIEIIENCKVKEIIGKNIIFDSRKISYDVLLITCGMRPNILLAKEAGLEVEKGIIINEYLQTSDKNIYACGDCTEYIDKITEKRTLSMLGSIAVNEGKTIAKNILGEKEKFPYVLNAAVSRIGKYYLGRIGITEEKAKEEGMKYVCAEYMGETKPEYCPEKKKIMIKMIADKKGKIIGAQIFGEEEVAPRINLISTAMSNEMTVYDFAKIETCYNPMSSPIFEPLMIAAEICVKKLER